MRSNLMAIQLYFNFRIPYHQMMMPNKIHEKSEIKLRRIVNHLKR